MEGRGERETQTKKNQKDKKNQKLNEKTTKHTQNKKRKRRKEINTCQPKQQKGSIPNTGYRASKFK